MLSFSVISIIVNNIEGTKEEAEFAVTTVQAAIGLNRRFGRTH